jgi:signal transduction histidine kinase
VLLVAVEVQDPAPEGTWAVGGALLFMFALQRQRLDAVLAGTAFAVVGALVDAPWSKGGIGGGVFGIFTLAAAMVGIGQWVQAQRKYVVAEVGRRREETERRRVEVARHVVEERLRIARDLHDSVAHHIAVVNVQTNLARANLPVSIDAADLALQSVQTAARDVLSELQLVLGVLRDEPDATGARAGVGTDVQSDRVQDLASSYQELGLHIESTGLDLFPTLPKQTRAAVYRILQEAFTNAHRYGDGNASLSLKRTNDGCLEVNVRNAINPSTVASSGGGGHGLIGMKERVGALGGSLDAKSQGHEFVIRARVPATAGLTPDTKRDPSND